MKIFTRKDNTFVVNVDKLEALIPQRYENFYFCTINETISTFGIFDLWINNSILKGLCIPNFITIAPKEINNVVIEDKTYIQGVFNKGDIFMTNRTIVKNKFLVIKMFKEFIGFANLPRFINYTNCHLIFKDIEKMTEMNMMIDPSTLEMIWAYLYRLSDNLQIQARYGSPDANKEFIGLRNISYGPDSTSAKIFGSYMSDGLNSALVNPNEQSKQLEDIMRL